MDWDYSILSTKKDAKFFENIDEDLDLAIALSLQEEFNEDATQEVLSKEARHSATSSFGISKSAKPIGIVDKQWEVIDPNPDIHALFLQFNTQFFYGKLLGVEVKWSHRMTLCAGVCSYEGRGGLCSVRLSSPLLKLRPRRDLVETLLHEMIHAYLFVTANYKDHDAHGPEFLSHMYRINKESGTNITVYHSFHDEVDHFRQHWWKCNGPCQQKRPFYGVVKRAMNRPPGPNDRWWAQHQATCGGSYSKIKEPAQAPKQSTKRKHTKESTTSKNSEDIKNFFQSTSSTSKAKDLTNVENKKKKGEANIQTITSVFEKENNLVSVNSNDSIQSSLPQHKITTQAFSGKGFALGSSSSLQPMSLLSKIRKEIGYPNLRTEIPGNSSKKKSSENSLKDDSTKNKLPPSTGLNNKKELISKNVSGKGSFLGGFQSSKDKSTKKFTQSSINSFITSPERTLKKESSVVSNVTANEVSVNNLNSVCCPVCSCNVASKDINLHLDNCLNSS